MGIKVYIAGPYTKGDVAQNVRAAMLLWETLRDAGFTPFCPHWTHFLAPRPYEDWLAFDVAWLQHCEVVFRMPGESAGADREVEFANTLGIPVVRSLHELYAWATQHV